MLASIPPLGFITGLAAACGTSVLLTWWGRRSRFARALADAQRLRESARVQAREVGEQAQVRAANDKATREREARERAQREREDLEIYEADVQTREEAMLNRENEAGIWEKELELRGSQLETLRNALNDTRAVVQALDQQAKDDVEARSAIARHEARDQLVTEQVDKYSLATQIAMRRLQEHTTETAAHESRRLMSLAIDRYDGVAHLERIQNAIPIPDAKMFLALSDPQAAPQLCFAREVGCELHADESTGVLIVRGDDPLAREIGRRVLRQLANRTAYNPDRIINVSRQVKDEVDREVQNAGRKALRILGLARVHPEILNLVGRLKYRLSYSQNQWKHAIEVAYLSGLMAEELGLDVTLARRGGLLHDIGKAMTHDREGSHAVLGAEVARRCGEVEVVANAIGSHHNDEPANTAIASIVTAADAISGARPGARREAVTQYMDRVDEIHNIAARSQAVHRVDIMQAGREVRVMVGGDVLGDIDASEQYETAMLSDDELPPLAREIARNIEEEVTYAGQIRVTVIRESRAVAIAR